MRLSGVPFVHGPATFTPTALQHGLRSNSLLRSNPGHTTNKWTLWYKMVIITYTCIPAMVCARNALFLDFVLHIPLTFLIYYVMKDPGTETINIFSSYNCRLLKNETSESCVSSSDYCCGICC